MMARKLLAALLMVVASLILGQAWVSLANSFYSSPREPSTWQLTLVDPTPDGFLAAILFALPFFGIALLARWLRERLSFGSSITGASAMGFALTPFVIGLGSFLLSENLSVDTIWASYTYRSEMTALLFIVPLAAVLGILSRKVIEHRMTFDQPNSELLIP